MGKYSTVQTESSVKKKDQLGDAWRAIGCVMMVIIPAVSIFAASATVQMAIENHWRIIPTQLKGRPHMPDIAYSLSGLRTILEPITKIENFYAIVAVSLVYMVLISGVISVIYAAIHTAMGPSRYGPLDAPPIKVKIRKKSR
ncbi:MAG: hypothetical protein HY865_21845 [Chloroflexi bacterium]|nr:hypothetical protein [Chloroflexota bacterium]